MFDPMKKRSVQIRKTILWLVCAVSTWFGSQKAASAQSPFGSIDAHVEDNHQGVVVGAKVYYRNESNGASDVCTTNQRGNCRLENIPPGAYTVEVIATGFKKWIDKGVVVRTAPPEVNLSPTVEPGQETEIVIVSAEVPLLETTTTTVSLSGRDYSSLMIMAPGVASGSMSIDGARPSSSSYTVEGFDSTDSYQSGALSKKLRSAGEAAALTPGEATGDVRISTGFNSFDSSLGGEGGATLSVLVQSGTNHLHGSVYEHFRNNILNARDFFNSEGPENFLRYNNYGGSIGGFFKRDKAFWFASYDGRRTSAEISTLVSVPNAMDFTQAVVNLGGNPLVPLVQNPVVNPIIRNLLALCISSSRCPGDTNLWPAPTPSRASQVLNSIARGSVRSDSDNLILKADFNLNPQNRVSGYASLARDDSSVPLALAGGDTLPRTNTINPSTSRAASFSYVRELSNKSFDARVGWNRFSWKALDEDASGVRNPAQTIGLDTGVSNPHDFGLPHIAVRGFASLGSSAFSNPAGHISQHWEAAANLGWLAGIHGIKVGYVFGHTAVDSFNDPDFRGTLEFNTTEDFLAGRIARGSILKGNSNRTTIQSTHAAYFQDDVHLGHLQLALGVRWIYFGVLGEKNSLFSTYDPAVGLEIRKQLYHPDFNNFSPRVGLAWDLGGRQKSVVRGGASLYFLSAPQDFFVGRIQFNTFNAGVAYNAIENAPILVSRSPVATLVPGVPVFSVGSFTTDTRDVSTVAGIRTPYVLQYSLGLEQQIFRAAALKIGFVGSSGHKLFRLRDINFPIAPGGARPFDSSAILSAVAPNRPFVVNQLESSANSTFNAMQVGFDQRGWHGLTNNFNWTWSHSIDNASEGYDLFPNESSPDNPRFPNLERANSNFDTRHHIAWAVEYGFPAVESLGRLGRGWRILANLVVASGQPFSINFAEEFDSKGAYDFILRPDVIGNPLFQSGTPGRVLDLSAFRVPCTLDGLGTEVSNCLPGTLHFGNLGRNAFRGPDLRIFDLGIAKSTTLTERFGLDFRVDIFNLANHPNFASPLLPNFIARASQKGIGTDGRGGAAGAGCGTVTASDDCYLASISTLGGAPSGPFGAGGPRSIELSIKLVF